MQEMSLNEIQNKIRGDFDEQFKEKDKKDNDSPQTVQPCWVKDVYLDGSFVVTEKDNETYKVKFTEKDGTYKFEEKDEWTPVKYEITEVKKGENEDSEDDDGMKDIAEENDSGFGS